MFYCNMIPKKWQLKVKLLRKLFDDVIGIKVIHIYGCGYEMITLPAVFAISLSSEAVLALKSSRNVFMTAFYKTDFESLLSLYYGFHGHHTNVALGYVLSSIVLLFGVCQVTCPLMKGKDCFMLLFKSSRWQHYI